MRGLELAVCGRRGAREHFCPCAVMEATPLHPVAVEGRDVTQTVLAPGPPKLPLPFNDARSLRHICRCCAEQCSSHSCSLDAESGSLKMVEGSEYGFIDALMMTCLQIYEGNPSITCGPRSACTLYSACGAGTGACVTRPENASRTEIQSRPCDKATTD